MARPPNKDRSTVRDTQLALRLTQRELAELEAHVEEMNRRAHDAGFPTVMTLSSLVRLWIQERLGGAPDLDPRRQVRSAPNVRAAIAKLRAGRR